MSMSEAMVAEMRSEAANTRKMLEVVPADKLAWQPHQKSMALGRLTSHIAEIPGWATMMVGKDVLDFADSDFQPAKPDRLPAQLIAAKPSTAKSAANPP